jgi:hypothetical protein
VRERTSSFYQAAHAGVGQTETAQIHRSGAEKPILVVALEHWQQMPYMAFPSLYLGKKEKKPQKHTHIKSPIFNLSHWVATVLPNALENTIATQCIIKL